MSPGTNTANVERLSALMDREGLSAVVLRSGTNFTYLAGFDYAGTLARHLDFSDSPRGVAIVWPRFGAPVLVLNRFAVDRARRDSWIEDVVVFDDYGESLYERAAKVLRDLGLATGRIGFEKTVVSAADWAVLESALSGGMGSSISSRSNCSSLCATAMASAGPSFRWTSTTISTSRPTVSRTAPTLSTTSSTSLGRLHFG